MSDKTAAHEQVANDKRTEIEDLPVKEDNADEVKGGMIKADIVNRVVE